MFEGGNIKGWCCWAWDVSNSDGITAATLYIMIYCLVARRRTTRSTYRRGGGRVPAVTQTVDRWVSPPPPRCLGWCFIMAENRDDPKTMLACAPNSTEICISSSANRLTNTSSHRCCCCFFIQRAGFSDFVTSTKRQHLRDINSSQGATAKVKSTCE